MTLVSFTKTLPLRTRSMANARLHWAAKAKIVKAEREAVAMTCRDLLQVIPPCTIRLTRFGPRKLDDDNLRSALKAVRDEVANLLRLDDAHQFLRWEYAQESGAYAVRIDVTEDD